MLTDSILVQDDGLVLSEVGPWAEKKYEILKHYNRLFSTGMKKKWDNRVYIDLFSGAGKARIKGTNKILLTSPLIAMNIKDKYDQYIFCDREKENIEALRSRVKLEHPDIKVNYIIGDCNEKIDEICSFIPKYSKENKVLSFCFVDPFSLNIEFETIRKMSKYFVDFLILLALSMDAKRNESNYVEENNNKVEKFLGESDWRSRWYNEKPKGIDFRLFLATSYVKNMISLGYGKDSKDKMIEIRSVDKNLPLYHLAFFSRNDKGYEFWDKTKKSFDNPLFF